MINGFVFHHSWAFDEWDHRQNVAPCYNQYTVFSELTADAIDFSCGLFFAVSVPTDSLSLPQTWPTYRISRGPCTKVLKQLPPVFTFFGPGNGNRSPSATNVVLFLGFLLSDFQRTEAFSFQNRSSLNFSYSKPMRAADCLHARTACGLWTHGSWHRYSFCRDYIIRKVLFVWNHSAFC